MTEVARYPSFLLRAGTTKVVGTLLARAAKEGPSALDAYPDAWMADPSLWVAIRQREAVAPLEQRWRTSPAGAPLIQLVTGGYDISAFIRVVASAPPPDPTELTPRDALPAAHWQRLAAFADPPSPRAPSTLLVRDMLDAGSTIVERAGALRTLLDLAGDDGVIGLGDQVMSARGRIERDLDVVLQSWFSSRLSDWPLDELAGRVYAASERRIPPLPCASIARLLVAIVPQPALEVWRSKDKVKHDGWDALQYASLALVTTRHLSRTRPLRPFPGAITDRLVPIAHGTDPQLRKVARNALCLAEAGWIAKSTARAALISELLAEADASDELARLYCAAIARERSRLAEAELEVARAWFFRRDDLSKTTRAARLALLPVVGTRKLTPTEAGEVALLVRQEPLSQVVESVRHFAADAVAAGNAELVSLLAETLEERLGQEGNTVDAKATALTLFELSEHTRKAPEARPAAVQAFRSVAGTELLKGDLDVQRALWRVDKL